MKLIHAVLAAEMKKEKEKRLKLDQLSEKERNVLIRLGIEREMKSTEIMYWLRIGALMVDGLTADQAREKMYQDLLQKGDEKMARMVREFQDKVHPLENRGKAP
jgi:FixJ family two-component response regulator